jgi:invasion protein IalB
MDDAIIKDLSGAETTDVSLSAVNGNGVKFSVNMKGFAQALANVSKS